MQRTLFDNLEPEKEKPAKRVVNVASVPMRSPFRYAGGKTWLVPRVRLWLKAQGGMEKELIEPFTGGGIISLTAVFENLVAKATMVELDEDVAAVWHVMTRGDAQWLADKIVSFDLTPERARAAIEQADKSTRDRAFATIVKNRVQRGGILAPGAGFIKTGEAGKGIKSRWYPTTLKRRIMEIHQVRDRIDFIEGDGFDVMQMHQQRTDVVYFIDPPYTKAGRRLYRYAEMDHEALFKQAAMLKGDFLMTYDDAPEICLLAKKCNFETRAVPMKNTHHAKKLELLIGRDLSWLQE